MINNNIMQRVISTSLKKTKELGAQLAQVLEGGEVILLSGELGAGKTSFIQGLAQGLGIKEVVNSPTFNIMHLYKYRDQNKSKTFCHIDAYRLQSGQELIDLGIEEIWQKKDTITAIEWPEHISDIIDFPAIAIVIKALDENKRVFKVIK